ncbi:hypothetical protein PV328_007898 [Microctonus aethiopoides]|uniref:Uncharacterized protein n=1 Tax=Microctonus aethiopoides TaxID=144406 RepID=A0AA39C9Q0_9HYME|nr:hypothetical protein PV328_007898 [Microctonus aethiopoides]
MYISEQEICRWGETNPSKRNYIEEVYPAKSYFTHILLRRDLVSLLLLQYFSHFLDYFDKLNHLEKMELDYASYFFKDLYHRMLEAVEYRVEQRIIRQKRERKWVREAARRLSEEEDLLIPFNFPEEEVYDFFGIRWLLDGNWGLDHPLESWGLLGGGDIYSYYDGLLRRKNLKRKRY